MYLLPQARDIEDSRDASDLPAGSEPAIFGRARGEAAGQISAYYGGNSADVDVARALECKKNSQNRLQ